jgi:DHA1 family multidrug resistance protein-like MFS transporter
MESIRDSAFGHLVRLFSGRRLLQFAEEVDPEVWHTFVQEPTPTPDLSQEGALLMTVRSQASFLQHQRDRTGSLSSYDPEKNLYDAMREHSKVIGWRGDQDSEVWCPHTSLRASRRFLTSASCRIPRTGVLARSCSSVCKSIF